MAVLLRSNLVTAYTWDGTCSFRRVSCVCLVPSNCVWAMSQGSVTEYSSDESLTSGAAADRRTPRIARTDVLNVDRVPSGELAKTLKCAPRIVISAISRLCTSGDNLEKLFRVGISIPLGLVG